MNKTLVLITLGLIFSQVMASAQSYQLKSTQTLHNNISRSSTEVHLDVEPKAVKKAWKNYLEEMYDVDVDGFGFFNKKDLLSVNQALISDISNRQIDLYAKIIEQNGKTQMNVFGAFGYDYYFSPSEEPIPFYAMTALVQNFLSTFLPEYYEEVVEDSKDTVEDGEERIRDLRQEIKKNKESIVELSKENIELASELAQAEQRLKKVKKTLLMDKQKLKKANQIKQ